MPTPVTRPEVQQLLHRSAQIVDVLHHKEFEDSHLPGAVHLPLGDIARDAHRLLEAARPTVVYCYDSLCDLSPRAAARLETLGFTEVYDYAASKVDWIGAGLPFEGRRADAARLSTLAETDAPTCGLTDRTAVVRESIGEAPLCVVVDDDRIVLGVVSADDVAEDAAVAAIMQSAPKTYRPHVTASEMLDSLDRHRPTWVLVTNLDGTLVGVADPERIRVAADNHSAAA